MARAFDSIDNQITTSNDTPVTLLSYTVAGQPEAYIESALIALANELAEDALAHFATEGAVHLEADTESAGMIIPATATTVPEAIERLVSVQAASINHAASTTAHSAVDAASYAAVVGVPASSVPESAHLSALLRAAHNTHVGLEDPVHDEADGVNVVDSPDVGRVAAIGKATLSVMALDEANSNGRVWEYKIAYRMSAAGTLTIIGTPQNTLDQGDSPDTDTWALSAIADGGNLLVQVTGTISETIVWLGAMQLGTTYMQ